MLESCLGHGCSPLPPVDEKPLWLLRDTPEFWLQEPLGGPVNLWKHGNCALAPEAPAGLLHQEWEGVGRSLIIVPLLI